MKYQVLYRKYRFSLKYNDVCVILPTYNQADYLWEALLSVVGQTLPNIRLAVVDDCSTDGTKELLLKFADLHKDRFTQLLILSTRKNLGPVHARNIAIKSIAARYYFMLDSDNYILPSCMEKLLNALKYSKAAFAYPIIQKFGDKNGLVSYLPWNLVRLRNGNYIDNMTMIRGTWLRKAGYYQENACADGWEDYDLWIRIALKGGSGIQVPEVLARYRVHDLSRSNTLARQNAVKMRTFIKEAYQELWKMV